MNDQLDFEHKIDNKCTSTLWQVLNEKVLHQGLTFQEQNIPSIVEIIENPILKKVHERMRTKKQKTNVLELRETFQLYF